MWIFFLCLFEKFTRGFCVALPLYQTADWKLHESSCCFNIWCFQTSCRKCCSLPYILSVFLGKTPTCISSGFWSIRRIYLSWVLQEWNGTMEVQGLPVSWAGAEAVLCSPPCRQQIMAALNSQTAVQFQQYAAQQYPGNFEQQQILIRQLQEQHYQQYMQQLYQVQLAQQQVWLANLGFVSQAVAGKRGLCHPGCHRHALTCLLLSPWKDNCH